jgi:hypothetical protein
VTIVFDEMKIKSSLVFDKNSGEIVGFTDLGDPELTFSSIEDEQPIATTVLAFLVRGLMTSLIKVHSVLLFHISSCNIFPDLQLLLASRVSAGAQSGSLVCCSNSRWWFAQQEIFQVT